MRIGLYGGTFDPVHMGHLIVAEQARVELTLQRVLFVLTPNPPHKTASALTPVTHRLEMLALAIADNPNFAISTAELDRHGASYTVDTLRHFRAQVDLREAELFLIIGADSFLEIKNWREPQAIVSLAKLAVYPRPGLNLQHAAPEFLRAAEILHGPAVEISASDVRSRCARGAAIRYLVPNAVRNYILRHHLYHEN
jgi:nicotinate-nucleotide adenylyltransferase